MRSRVSRYKGVKKMKRALNGMFDTVRPTSKYASTYAGFPEDMDDWNCGHWKSYYLNNKAIIGQAEAVKLLEIDIESIGTWATGQLCKYDCAWMDFFSKEGIKGGSIFSKIYCAGSGTADAVSSTVDSVGGLANFVSSVANNKLLLLGVGLGGWYVYKRVSDGKK